MSDKQALFLLPGFLCDETVWFEQVKALEPYVNITIPSFRGMNSLKDMAQSVLDQAPEKFSVVGHSMGGRVAFEIIHMAEERIDKFAVMDTGVHPVQPGEKEKRKLILDIAYEHGMDELAKEWTPPMLSPKRWDDKKLLAAIMTMAKSYTLAEYAGQLLGLLARDDQSKYLSQIEKHVLLICGDEDSWSPVSQHEEIMSQLKNAELKIINNSGHMITMEQPEQVNRILLDWLGY
jgi:pimeloyl-ACP methyl ester carboxylesterase